MNAVELNMNRLNKVVEDYIKFVFKWDENGDSEECWRWCEHTDDPKFDEYLEDGFKFSAVNNWASGFDIVDWYEGRGDYAIDGHYKSGGWGLVADLLDFQTCCKVVSIIQTYFDANYGEECLMDCKDLTPEKVLRNYAYTYLYQMSNEDLKKLLVPPVRERRRMTPEEYSAYMDEKYPNRPTCCFCGKKTECPYGNNPAPVAKRGKCCGACNNVVVYVRIGLIPVEVAKKNKKNLQKLYDLVHTPVEEVEEK